MKYPLFGLGVEGRSPNVTAQNRRNLYFDIQKRPDKTAAAAYPTPGLVDFCAPSGDVTRGLWAMESTGQLYAVQGQRLHLVAHDGNSRPIAELSGNDIAGRVSMSDNGTQLIIVSGSHGYVYDTQTGAFSRSDHYTDFPGGDTVCFLDSYFIVNRPRTAQFFLSAQYDGTNWSGGDFATAEANPDPLVAVAADRGGLALFGTISTELWYNTGALDFPFSRIQGAPSEAGLAARWSLAKCEGMWTGLFRNRQTGLFIGRLNGYNIETVSVTDLDYLINGYADPGDAVAFSFTSSGHNFYQITFQRQGCTWLYDATSGIWSQADSGDLGRHVADLGVSFGSTVIVSDYRNGRLYRLDPDCYTHAGLSVTREIVGTHVFSPSTLNLSRIRRLRLDMEGGVGLLPGEDLSAPGVAPAVDTGTRSILMLGASMFALGPVVAPVYVLPTAGVVPQVMLQISRDGGHTWGGEMWRTIGPVGEYASRAEWRRLGRSRDWLFRVRLTDPVKAVFINAFVEAEEMGA
jgi:hypothetical protein